MASKYSPPFSIQNGNRPLNALNPPSLDINPPTPDTDNIARTRVVSVQKTHVSQPRYLPVEDQLSCAGFRQRYTHFPASGEDWPTHARACQVQRTVLPTSRELPTRSSGSFSALRRWHRGICCAVLENNSWASLCEQSDGELVSSCSVTHPRLILVAQLLSGLVSPPGGRRLEVGPIGPKAAREQAMAMETPD